MTAAPPALDWGMRARVLLCAALVALGMAACDDAPPLLLNQGQGTPLTAFAGPIGRTTRLWSGSDAGGDTVTMQSDENGDVSLGYSATITPKGGPAYHVAETFLWTGLVGGGAFYLPEQQASFADAAVPSLTDLDQCGGTLQLNADGSFSITLSLTGVRYPGGVAPGQVTTVQILLSGVQLSGTN